jgi:alginate O-acetyltransferase complex protein AlgI
MLFNSLTFILGFLPITLGIFFLITKLRLIKLSIVWLLLASLGFYCYWSINALFLLLFSIAFNYIISLSLVKSNLTARKSLLFLGIFINTGIIFYFKYFNSFAIIALHNAYPDLKISPIVLPLGISFYTFTQIAYLIDVYRERAIIVSPITYALFVTLFPHLIAGPLLNYRDMVSQLSSKRKAIFSQKNFCLGIALFTIGLAKKVLIADTLFAGKVDFVFNNISLIHLSDAWIGVFSYTFQLYFDFSGYSDMAIALGLMINLYLPMNFNSPYKSTSIIDFWRRWHISLSSFLRDYLYIPMGGNRYGEKRRYVNILVTMSLGGIWHGAGGHFFIWGILHGTMLVFNHLWRKLKLFALPRFLSWAITFFLVSFSWVFFRSPDLSKAIELINVMIGFQYNLDLAKPIFGVTKHLLLLILFGLIVTISPNSQQLIEKFKFTLVNILIVSAIFSICLLRVSQPTTFLYFNF